MSEEHVHLPRPIRVYLIATLALTAIALFVVGLRRFAWHQGYPYNTLLFDPDVAFSDFTVYHARFEHFGTARFFTYPGHPFTYPAPLALLYAFYFHWTPNPSYAFLATIVAVVLIATAFLIRGLRDAGLAGMTAGILGLIVLLTSYPTMMLLDRGNVEIVAWIALTAGLCGVLKDKYWLGSMLIGLAASLKLVPGVFLLLLIYQKRYREFIFGVVVAMIATVGALVMMGPDVQTAYRGIHAGLDQFTTMYVFHWRPREIGFDHSAFSILKALTVYFRPSLSAVSVKSLQHDYKFYSGVVGVFGIGMLWRLRKLTQLNQLLAIACCALVLPPLSGDYTLVHLYVPLAALLFFVIRTGESLDTKQRWLVTRLLLYFAVLLTPQSYLISGMVGFGGQVKAAVLLVFLAECLISPLQAMSPASAR